MQWQGPDVPIPGQGSMTILSATEDIVDWLEQQEDTMGIYIYENWPDMAGYLSNGFPATESEFTNYNNYTLGEFHDWWLDYHDLILASRPDLGIKMIPVGPLLAELFSNTVLSDIPISELYEDDAPHGRATTYFLAGLITYTAICQTEAPLSFVVPEIVHPIVRDNYGMVACFIHDYLINFTDANGQSRVFAPSTPLPVELVRFSAELQEEHVKIKWETTAEINLEKFEIEERTNDDSFSKIGEVTAALSGEINNDYYFLHENPKEGQHFYRLKQVDLDGSFEYSDIISVTVNRSDSNEKPMVFYPNPTMSGQVQLNYFMESSGSVPIKIYDLNGICLTIKESDLEKGNNTLTLDLSGFGKGIFVIRIGEQDYGRVMFF